MKFLINPPLQLVVGEVPSLVMVQGQEAGMQLQNKKVILDDTDKLVTLYVAATRNAAIMAASKAPPPPGTMVELPQSPLSLQLAIELFGRMGMLKPAEAQPPKPGTHPRWHSTGGHNGPMSTGGMQ